MKNEGTNTARMQNHRQQSRDCSSAARLDYRARSRNAGKDLGVNIFYLDRRLVDENADGKRKTAERHDVDGLSR